MSHTFHIIGVGGTGSWVLPALVRLFPESTIHIWDADILEPKNLDRQLFSHDHIGMSKSEAIASIYQWSHLGQLVPHNEWFHAGQDVNGIIICCADNHVARKACLDKSDLTRSMVIICGNEYLQSDAYIYLPDWKGTKLDPRVMFPEINTDHSGDPMAREAGCTGDAQAASPQLVLANATSAQFGLRLLWWWLVEVRELDRANMEHWPVMFHCSANRMMTELIKDRNQRQTP